MEEQPILTLEPGIYRHFKGNLYRVIGIARHSEDLAPHVVYQALYDGNSLWVRPLAMFLETVQTAEGPVKRFERIGSEAGLDSGSGSSD